MKRSDNNELTINCITIFFINVYNYQIIIISAVCPSFGSSSFLAHFYIIYVIIIRSTYNIKVNLMTI